MNQLLFKQLSVQLAAETSFDRKILNAIKSSKFRLSSDVQGQKAVDDAMDFEFEEEFWNSFFSV